MTTPKIASSIVLRASTMDDMRRWGNLYWFLFNKATLVHTDGSSNTISVPFNPGPITHGTHNYAARFLSNDNAPFTSLSGISVASPRGTTSPHPWADAIGRAPYFKSLWFGVDPDNAGRRGTVLPRAPAGSPAGTFNRFGTGTSELIDGVGSYNTPFVFVNQGTDSFALRRSRMPDFPWTTWISIWNAWVQGWTDNPNTGPGFSVYVIVNLDTTEASSAPARPAGVPPDARYDQAPPVRPPGTATAPTRTVYAITLGDTDVSDRVIHAEYAAGIENPADYFNPQGSARAGVQLVAATTDTPASLTGQQIQIQVTPKAGPSDIVSGQTRFVGFVSDVQRQQRQNPHILQLACVGALQWYALTAPPFAMPQQGNARAGSAIASILNAVPPRNPGGLTPSISLGVHTIRVSGLTSAGIFGSPRGRVAPFAAISAVARLEGGRLYSKTDGRIVFEGSDFRGLPTSLVAAFNLSADPSGDDPWAYDWQDLTRVQDIRNIIVAREQEVIAITLAGDGIDCVVNPIRLTVEAGAGAETYIPLPDDFDGYATNWELPALDASADPAASAYQVTAGQSSDIAVSLLPASQVAAPAPGTGEAPIPAGLPGGGTADYAIVRFDNSGSAQAMVSLTRLRAAGLRYNPANEVDARDQASITAYGERRHILDARLLPDKAAVQAYADRVLAVSKDPRPVYTCKVNALGNRKAAELASTIQPGAYITIDEDAAAVTGYSGGAWVEQVRGRLEGINHEVTLVLTPA